MLCKVAKKYYVNIPRSQIARGQQKLETLHMDIFGDKALKKYQGYCMILSVMDAYTNFVQFFPLRNSSWQHIQCTLIQLWIRYFGYPTLLHMDQGLLSNEGEGWLNSKGIAFTQSGAYAHAQNGKVERVHRFLLEQLIIFKLMKDRDLEGGSWVDQLPMISLRYNSCRIENMGRSPYAAVFQIDSRAIFHEAWDHLANTYGKVQQPKQSKEPMGSWMIFEGDRVLWKPRKPGPKFQTFETIWVVCKCPSSKVIELKILFTGSHALADVRDLTLLYAQPAELELDAELLNISTGGEGEVTRNKETIGNEGYDEIEHSYSVNKQDNNEIENTADNFMMEQELDGDKGNTERSA